MKKLSFLKKIAVLTLALFLLLGAAACGTTDADEAAEVSEAETAADSLPDEAAGTDSEIEDFIAAEGGYNASLYNASEKYGSVLAAVSDTYSDGESVVYTIYAAGENAVIDYGEDGVQMLYGGQIYEITTSEDGPVFTRQAFYQEDSIPKEEFVDIGYIFSSEDYDISLVTEEDGSFTWTSSFDCATDISEDGYATAVLTLNEDYEVTESHTTFYYADGSVFCEETVAYTPAAEEPASLAQLAEALDATEGQTRHLAFHIVSDGQVTGETWELDVPAGFSFGVTFTDEFYDEEGNVYVYTDEAMTELVGEPDLYADADYYIEAN